MTGEFGGVGVNKKQKRSEVMKSQHVQRIELIEMSARTALMMAFALVVGLNLVGCTGSVDRPTEEQGKAVILDRIKQEDHAGAVKLLSYRKTNGLVQEALGVKTYRLEFECEIEHTRDCSWWDLHNEGSFWTYPGSDGGGTVKVQQGHRGKVTGFIDFQKTENGWRATNIHPLH